MKPVAIVGLVLLMLGIAALVYQGFTYTTRETVLDIGGVKVTAGREKTVLIPTVAGIAAVAGGVVLLIVGSRRNV